MWHEISGKTVVAVATALLATAALESGAAAGPGGSDPAAAMAPQSRSQPAARPRGDERPVGMLVPAPSLPADDSVFAREGASLTAVPESGGTAAAAGSTAPLRAPGTLAGPVGQSGAARGAERSVPLPELTQEEAGFFRRIQDNERKRQELDSKLKVRELERKLEELGTLMNGTADDHRKESTHPASAATGGGDFALLSTFGDARDLQAVIAVRGGGQVTVRPGDTLPGDWTVRRVSNYRVLLSRAGNDRELAFGDMKK